MNEILFSCIKDGYKQIQKYIMFLYISVFFFGYTVMSDGKQSLDISGLEVSTAWLGFLAFCAYWAIFGVIVAMGKKVKYLLDQLEKTDATLHEVALHYPSIINAQSFLTMLVIGLPALCNGFLFSVIVLNLFKVDSSNLTYLIFGVCTFIFCLPVRFVALYLDMDDDD
ncbi:hypothetical protein [Candidatus Uabimicrobium amorphum]|uniref:Uncharacterized protein n=1 Tax=Uabimicrobium amorphum TaxID=2596890 RepID=A0A5S9IMB4_UABAM|nr:hypothetical protein [Candidatus Uabimicrobium amorphum]BBM84147.1 hypothetical protein UABAM_02503 [Candidatus Uabimicrobium amorphum]